MKSMKHMKGVPGQLISRGADTRIIWRVG